MTTSLGYQIQKINGAVVHVHFTSTYRHRNASTDGYEISISTKQRDPQFKNK